MSSFSESLVVSFHFSLMNLFILIIILIESKRFPS